MSEGVLLDAARQAIQIALVVCLPLLAASLLTGLVVSVLQVATSLQDATLTFVPKIVVVAAVLLLTGRWMLRLLLDFTRHLIASVPGVV